MKSIGRFACVTLFAGLVACSQSLPASTSLSPERVAAHASEAKVPALPVTVVYSFKGGNDGSAPTGNLIELNGTLFGTTSSGGSSDNLGTVFKAMPQGNEQVIYRFVGGPSGNTPDSGLTLSKGALFGLTSAQLFSLAPSGASYRALDTFESASAEGPLVGEKGRLYGVTHFGGLKGKGCTDRCGSVFVSNQSGVVQTLYEFRGGVDGGEPGGGLIAVKGALYGTTTYGGTHGGGTVFKITTSGQHQVLFSFNPKTDGAGPAGTLYESGGVLYGTAEGQGKYDSGTMFAVTLSGHASILRQFGAAGDASNPTGSLIEVKNVFYGTSAFGGAHNAGALFAVDKTGNERALYSFAGSSSANPGLIDVGGALYGSTEGGGKSGAGSIFKVKL
jgi:uncharacterized repeat protein (TIGR03803 family)